MPVNKEDNFKKEIVTKSDGRYLIYYNFSVQRDEEEDIKKQHGMKRRK